MTDASTNLSSDQLRRMVVGTLSNPRLRRVLAEIIEADDPPITATSVVRVAGCCGGSGC